MTHAPRPKARRPALLFAPRPVSLAVCLLLGAPAALALPSNPTPTSGQTTVQQTAPNQLDIKQATPRAGLDWTSFSIAAGERVIISQPGRDAILLNRVVGNDPSQIFGSLQANGQVWLINPRGIVFGTGSQVDVGGLLASTLSLGNVGAGEDFAAGRLSLSRGTETPGSLRSEGSIRAPGGSVVLVAPQLQHSGSIEARRIGLAAATHVNVDVEGDGLIFFNTRNDGSLDARLAQLGRLTADGGTAEMRAAARAGFADSVLNMDGVVQARAIGQRSGRVIIDGGRAGNTLVTGQVDVSGRGAGEHGGDATLLGQQLGLTRTASVDASGDTGGGSVRVGGDYQGRNAELSNSRYTVLQQGASLQADATGQGDGGRVIVWSDQSTRFQGDISARGGAQGGNGGFAEVSGKQTLDFNGRVDLSATRGRHGTLLLDPRDLTIQDADPNINGTPGNDLTTPTLVFNFPDPAVGSGPAPGQPATTVDSVITKAAVNTLLDTGNVILQANNNILVAATVGAPPATNAPITGLNSLTLQAGGNIDIAAPINTNGLTLSANDPGSATRVATGRVSNSAALNAGTGDLLITSNGGSGVHQVNANVSGTTLTINGSAAINAVATGTTSVTLGSGIASDTSTFTLNAAGSLATPTLTVASGTLRTTGNEQIDDTAALNIGTIATLNLGGTETVKTLDLSGTLAGTAASALTASTSAALSGGKVNAALNTPLLSSSGTSSITAATSASTSATVTGGTLALDAGGSLAAPSIAVTGGTLATTASNQIGDAAAVSVTAAAALNLGGTERINSLTLSGTLTGTNLLTVATSTSLNGVNLATPLNTATLTSSGTSSITSAATATTSATVTGGALTLGSGGTLASPVVVIAAGALTTTAVDQIGDAAAVSVTAGAAFNLGGTERINSLALSGNLTGTSPLAVTTFTTLNGVTLATPLNTATLSSSGTSSITAPVSASTSATVTSGTLTLGTGGSLATPTININTNIVAARLATTTTDQIDDAAAVNVATGATFTVGGAETISTLALSGSLNGAGPLTAATSATLSGGSVATALNTATLSSSGPSSITAPVTASTSATVTGGTLTLGTGGSLNTPAVGVDAGTLVTTGTEQIGDTAAAIVAGGARFTVGGTETIGSLDLSGNLNGAGALTATTFANLTGGSVNGRLNTAALSSTGASSISAPTSASSTAAVAGGTLTLASGGTLAAPTVGVNAGTLVTTTANQIGDTSALSIANNASFALGGNETIGALADGAAQVANGTASVALGASRLTVASNAASTSFGGVISGDAASGFTKSGTGALTLTGVNTYTGATTVNGGGTLQIGSTGSLGSTALDVTTGATLRTAAADRLASTASVTVGSNSVLDLGGAQTVSTLALAGTLSSAGTLTTAGATSLNGGTVNAAVNAATLSSTGGSTINSRVTASSATVTGGNLTLAAGGQLNTQQVNVNAGRLTTQTSTTVVDQIPDGATIGVSSGATLTVNGLETLSTLALSGTLDGTGTLTASTLTALSGGTVRAPLQTATLVSAGTSAIFAGVGSTSAVVTDGTLTLGTGGSLALRAGAVQTILPITVVSPSAPGNIVALVTTGSEQIANQAVVNVASGSTVSVGGTETISSLDLSGTLNGAGTLNATTSATLNGASVAARLNTATLSSSGDTSIMAATTASTAANVISGTLTLGSGGSLTTPSIVVNAGTLVATGSTPASNQIGDATTVTVGTGATFTVGGAETINALNLSGTLNGAGALAATSSASLTSGSVAAALNTATLTSSGASSITAPVTAISSATVSGGTLTLGAGGSLAGPAIAVNAGTLVTTGTQQIGDAAAVNVASGAIFTVGGAESINQLTLSGALNGAGPLRATTSATLSGGSVNTGLDTATLTSSGAASINAAVSASTSATVTGGTLTLGNGGTVSSSGSLNSPLVQLDGGALITTRDEQIGNTAAVRMANGTTLTLGGNETIASLADKVGELPNGSAKVDLGVPTVSRTLTVASATADTSFGGAIVGNDKSHLTKSGASRQILTGVNTYSGTTDITGGTLELGPGGALSNTSAVNVSSLLVSRSNEQINDNAAVNVATGATLTLGGRETVRTLALAGTLASTSGGAGLLDASSSATLTGGTVNARLSTAALGSSGISTINAATTVDAATVTAGVLTLGSGGSLGARGTGAGSTYTVDVNGGTLVTTTPGQLRNLPTVRVAPAARLTLGGTESLGSIDASGSVDLGGNLSTTRDMTLAGAVVATGGRALTLSSGAGISAVNAGNHWGSSLSIDARGPLALSSGVNAGAQRDLTLGTMTLAAGGQVDAGVLTLSDNITLSGGTLTLRGLAAAATPAALDPALAGKQTPTGRPIVFAPDVVLQTGGRLDVAPGALLSVRAPGDGSVNLQSAGNAFAGGLEVISGTPNSAWTDRPRDLGNVQPALQSQVRLNAGQLNVAGAGLEADVLTLRADAITTAAAGAAGAGTPAAVITARLPFDSQLGVNSTLPGLTLITTDAGLAAAAAGGHPYGVAGGGEIAINVGSSQWGQAPGAAPRTGPSSGYISVLPQNSSPGSLTVVLSGPAVDVDGYSFFSLGAGKEGSIPVFYNGSGTRTATEAISLGSTLSVVESARKERFDDAVRTENVAVRLRQGVIAEVGPGRPATQGSEGLRPPLVCPPASLSLSCEP